MNIAERVKLLEDGYSQQQLDQNLPHVLAALREAWADLAAAQGVVGSLAERVQKQSDLLGKRAARCGECDRLRAELAGERVRVADLLERYDLYRDRHDGRKQKLTAAIREGK